MSPAEYKRSIVTINKEVLAELTAAEFKGEICVVETIEELANAIKELRKEKILGFDTETRPTFRKGQQYNVALVQLSTSKKSYLIRTNRIGYPQELIDLLEDSGILKVGLSIHDDFLNLRRVTELSPSGFIDLQQYVKDYKIADNSLSRVYAILFGERISKGQRLSNWEANELSEAQQKYAAMDAFACIRIYQYLQEGKFDPAKSQYLTLPPEPEESEYDKDPGEEISPEEK